MRVNCLKFLVVIMAYVVVPVPLMAGEGSVTRPVTSYSLPNGLKVLLYSDPRARSVTVNVVYKSGARHEGPGEDGVAHLLEHIAFQKTVSFADIPSELQRRGAQFNANTNADRTTYYATLPASSDNLQFALTVEAERMTRVPIDEAIIRQEKSAVAKERAISEQSGFQPLLTGLLPIVYPQHPYGRDTFGWDDGVMQVKPETVQAFYHRRYRPDLAVLSIGGLFDESEARRLIDKLFAPIPGSSEAAPPSEHRLKPQQDERMIVMNARGASPYVVVLYRAMPGADPSFVAAQALVHCLSNDPAGPLHKKLLASGRARQVFGFMQQSADESFFAFMARPGRGQDLLKLARSMAKLVEESRDDCQDKQLAVFQRSNAASWAELRDNTRALTLQLGEFEVLGDWRLIETEARQSQSLQPQDLRSVGRWLTRSNRSIGILGPEGRHSLAGRQQEP